MGSFFMIVMNRKRISIMMLVILMSIFTFAYQTEQEEIQETKYVATTPVSNKVVVLDAGHGSPDEGAESNNGTTEAKTNLKITLKVQQLLEQNGCTVILTRSDDNGIYDLDKTTLREKKISDIRNRVKIGNTSSADIFVSIHLNKIPQTQYSGWQCFFQSNSEKSKALAESLQNNLNHAIQKENKRVAMKLENVYIVKHVEIPLSIVECGFLSNPEEEKQLQTNEYQDRLAWGIYTGIINYFQG